MLRKRKQTVKVKLTLSSCEVEDSKQLALDLGGQFNQLATSIQILVAGNDLGRGKKQTMKKTNPCCVTCGDSGSHCDIYKTIKHLNFFFFSASLYLIVLAAIAT